MTDVRREQIPLVWNTAGETALAKSICANLGDMKYSCVCRRKKLPGRGVHSKTKKVREMSQRKSCYR